MWIREPHFKCKIQIGKMGNDIPCSYQPREDQSGYINIYEVDFKASNITGDKEDYFIITKGSVHQEDITILIICVPNNKT